MNYLSLKKCDIANGKYFHVTLWVSGCSHACPGCFNPQSHDFDAGKPFTEDTMQKILRELRREANDAFTVTGGDPLHPRNVSTVAEICKRVKEEIGCPVWLWTGYVLEDLDDAQNECLKWVDYVVDGPFIIAKRDISLKWRGSRQSTNLQATRNTTDFGWTSRT